jgi:hypothetical protein
MREAKQTDFTVQLPGVGNFIFGRRTYRDHAAIRAEYLRLTEGFEFDDEMDAFSSLLAIMKHLCVSAPQGWEDLGSQVMDDEKTKQAIELLALVVDQESRFRQGAIEGSEAPRQGNSE